MWKHFGGNAQLRSSTNDQMERRFFASFQIQVEMALSETFFSAQNCLCVADWDFINPNTVYPKAAKRSIPCAPLLSLNGSTVIIAAEELLAYN